MESLWKKIKICIPSYKRADTIQSKTLAVLSSYSIPPSMIHIFVANEEEKAVYMEKVPKELYGSIHVGVKGLAEVRNFIFGAFPVGTPLVEMDDDIQGFLEYSARARRNEKPLEDLKGVMLKGFAECKRVGCRFWGVYPVPNGFFMKPGMTSDLRFCVGSFWGCFNPGTAGVRIAYSEKEDYQRTLQFFLEDGAVVRFSNVAPKTAYYKEAGGLQEQGDRVEKQEAAVAWMMKEWPSWIRRNPARKSGFPEIRLVDPRSKEEKEERTGLTAKYAGTANADKKKRLTRRKRRV
jgi:hypothetical protein